MIFFRENEIRTYSFFEMLQTLYHGEMPLADCLTARMTEYEPDLDRETAARKVRNWKSDKNFPKNREKLFKICFALRLKEEEADELLGMTAESGIHFRNPREVIYAYCLRKEIDYPEACAMTERLWGKNLPTGGREYREYYRRQGSGESEENLTGAFRRSFKKIQSEEELEAFLEDRREKFGLMHNTAYRKFRKMLDCLMNPQQENSVYPKEQSYSIRKLVNEYIRMGVPYRRKTGQYTWIQREIKKHWPSDRSIYEMYKRKMDVDRKTLLLLYLATEGEGLQEAEETGVQEHQRKMNVMLAECGMPVLNDRNPFDSLVLQVCRESSEEDYIGMQMERAVRSIFAEENAEKTTGGGMDKNES